MKRGYSTSELIEKNSWRETTSPPAKKMVISGEFPARHSRQLLNLFTPLDIFQIYSPPPTKNKLNYPRGLSTSASSLPDHLPPGIPNVDLCNDLESRQKYDPTYAWSIMQYKSSIEV
jgi:hypothetical protein